MVRRRILGRRLRLLREQAGMTLEQAAPRLEWSTSTLSRIEIGQQAPNVHSVRSMLDLYGVGGPSWDELVTLTREVRQKGWWQSYGLGEHTSYVGYETEASHVLDYTLDYVPGLLQTADYTRALFLSSFVERTEDLLANQVAVRMIRQERLTSTENPLELAAIIDESVLHRAIGGPEVLDAQLAHLAEAALLDMVTLQVLPTSGRRRPTTGSGLIVLNFGDLDHPDLAYVEHALGALIIEKKADVARARLAFDRLRSDALNPADSLSLIQETAARA